MVNGFFYKRKYPKKDSIVIGKILKNIENLLIEIFLLEYNLLAFIKLKDLNTNTNGEHRAFVITGSYEEVFPLDIFPMQVLKACMYQDLDEMEALGMYEVAPEDFALTEFVCVSKQPHQKIIREQFKEQK